MCLAIPMKVIQVGESECLAELRGLATKVRTDLVWDVKPGDYLLVHAGFAIQKLDETQAQETIRLLDQITQSTPGGSPSP